MIYPNWIEVFIIAAVAFMLGMFLGADVKNDAIKKREKITIQGSVYTCKQLKTGY